MQLFLLDRFAAPSLSTNAVRGACACMTSRRSIVGSGVLVDVVPSGES